MKLRTFFSIFFLLLVALAGGNLALGVFLEKAQKDLETSHRELQSLTTLAEDLVFSSQWQTRFARGYISSNDSRRVEWYNIIGAILNGETARPKDYNFGYWDLVNGGIIPPPEKKSEGAVSIEERFLSQNVTAHELNKLKEARSFLEKVVAIERAAMHAVDGEFDDGAGTYSRKGKPDRALATKLLFSDEYRKLNGDLTLRIAQMQNLIRQRYAGRISLEEAFASQLFEANSYLNIGLFGVVVLSLIFLRNRFAVRASHLMSVVREIGSGNLAAQASVFGSDEISELATTVNTMAANLNVAFDKLEDKIKLSGKALSDLEIERSRSEKLLHNILPAAIAERLRGGEETIAEVFPEVTVFFSDIVGFTELSAKLGPHATVNMLNVLFEKFDELVEKHGVEKIKTIGDSYMVVGGVPNRDPLHCQHIADFALDAQSFIMNFAEGLSYPLKMRMGVHTGTVAAGVVGKKRFSYDLWGDVVNVASRFESTSKPDKIHVSEAVKVRLSDDYVFLDGGTVELKGKEATRSFFLIGKKTQMPGILEFTTPSGAPDSPSRLRRDTPSFVPGFDRRA
ncbi:adenylate/guanylate cyclase domain-containing protein [Methylocystis rosea]|uniref:HAMP domain-containing protein n=1 Tax=Methylocystis rosea TaxID=173366 RepID=A0A3G8M3L5_9HYPH|nr:adenylate/guanylate cyclase domain-containing protein [Methylocystis rosea]AZG75722.1 HAMP domain-containing protein [Methylocystis rosea]